MAKSKQINIQGKEITIIAQEKNDYISLTDMARSQLQEVVIIKWLSLKSTIEYLGEWEAMPIKILPFILGCGLAQNFNCF